MLTDDVPPAPWPDVATRWTGVPEATGGPREHFYGPRARRPLGQSLRRLVDEAGPVLQNDAWRAVAEAWGFARLGSRITDTLEVARKALPQAERPVLCGEHLWPADRDPVTWRGFRYVADGGDRRDAETLCPEEVANACAWILERGVSMSREALAREAAAVFGLSQLGRRVRETMDEGIEVLVARGDAAEDGGERVRWAGEGA